MIPPPKTTPILVVGNGQYGVLAAVRALRAAGYPPSLSVSKPETYAGLSRAKAGTVPVPDPDLDG